MAEKKTRFFYWGGFVEGELMLMTVDDKWGGENMRTSPAIFRTRKEARAQFQDVRKIEIRVVKP